MNRKWKLESHVILKARKTMNIFGNSEFIDFHLQIIQSVGLLRLKQNLYITLCQSSNTMSLSEVKTNSIIPEHHMMRLVSLKQTEADVRHSAKTI